MNNLNKIKNRKYSGYIWMSDERKPIILNNDNFDFLSIGTNPFIIEALLFSYEENISLSIRHTDTYQIHEFDLNNLDAESVIEDVEYLPYRLESVDKVCFKQLWVPEEDEYCEGLQVLKIKAIIFTGFKLKI